jgi:alkylated DNA nucleotide flippase Atl1
VEEKGKEIIEKLVEEKNKTGFSKKDKIIDLIQSPKEMTYGEIAEILGCSEGYVKQVGAKFHKEMEEVS